MNWRLAAAWVTAVVLTTAVAWQIVAVADERVGDSPLSPVEVGAPSTSETSTTTVVTEPTVPTTGPVESSTTTAPSTTSTTHGHEATTTEPEQSSTSSTSTTTTTAAQWSTKTIVTKGGTVVVSYQSGDVVLETAVPVAGFQVEIKKEGPPEVEVEFESEKLVVRIDAEWNDGELDIEIDENSRDGDD